jgi:hypothetical protein
LLFQRHSAVAHTAYHDLQRALLDDALKAQKDNMQAAFLIEVLAQVLGCNGQITWIPR